MWARLHAARSNQPEQGASETKQMPLMIRHQAGLQVFHLELVASVSPDGSNRVLYRVWCSARCASVLLNLSFCLYAAWIPGQNQAIGGGPTRDSMHDPPLPCWR